MPTVLQAMREQRWVNRREKIAIIKTQKPCSGSIEVILEGQLWRWYDDKIAWLSW